MWELKRVNEVQDNFSAFYNQFANFAATGGICLANLGKNDERASKMENRERRAPTLLFGEAHYLSDSAKITRSDSIRESEAKLSSPKEKVMRLALLLALFAHAL